jgi:hypothetical protein
MPTEFCTYSYGNAIVRETPTAFGGRHTGEGIKAMKLRLAAPLMLGLLAPFAAPASALPYCVVLGWHDGDSCSFEAPGGEFLFGGIATSPGQGVPAWVAVEVVFNGIVIDSCYGSGTDVATCQDMAQSFVSTLPYECRVRGTGGPKFHCADPPALRP